jgi:hypothetical protein
MRADHQHAAITYPCSAASRRTNIHRDVLTDIAVRPDGQRRILALVVNGLWWRAQRGKCRYFGARTDRRSTRHMNVREKLATV